jgi:TonB family protein
MGGKLPPSIPSEHVIASAGRVAVQETAVHSSRMIALLMLQLTTANVPPRHSDGRANIAGLFSMEDYPAEALKNGWEGDVRIKVHVGTDGIPHSCRIIHSSGHPVLDNYTCAIMFGRARFLPARDKFGQAVEDDFVLPTVHWLIEKPSRPGPSTDWRLIGADGGGREYLDFASILGESHYRTAWLRTVIAKPTGDRSAYWVNQYRFDCEKRTYAVLNEAGYSKDGTPVTTGDFPEDEQKAFSAARGSAIESALRTVCGEP